MKTWTQKLRSATPALLSAWLCLGVLGVLPQRAEASLPRTDNAESCQVSTAVETRQRLNLIPAGYFHQSDFSAACSLWKHFHIRGQKRPPASSFVPGVVHQLWFNVNRRVANAKQIQEQMFNSIRDFMGLDR